MPRQPALEAYEKIKPDITELQRKVIEFFLDSKDPEGITSDEISEYLGMNPYTIKPRFTELHHAGIIEKVGTKKNKWGNTIGSYGVVPLDKRTQLDLF